MEQLAVSWFVFHFITFRMLLVVYIPIEHKNYITQTESDICKQLYLSRTCWLRVSPLGFVRLGVHIKCCSSFSCGVHFNFDRYESTEQFWFLIIIATLKCCSSLK